eukprot:7238615-Alexandrium_andersonii.AAC.1
MAGRPLAGLGWTAGAAKRRWRSARALAGLATLLLYLAQPGYHHHLFEGAHLGFLDALRAGALRGAVPLQEEKGAPWRPSGRDGELTSGGVRPGCYTA